MSDKYPENSGKCTKWLEINYLFVKIVYLTFNQVVRRSTKSPREILHERSEPAGRGTATCPVAAHAPPLFLPHLNLIETDLIDHHCAWVRANVPTRKGQVELPQINGYLLRLDSKERAQHGHGIVPQPFPERPL